MVIENNELLGKHIIAQTNEIWTIFEIVFLSFIAKREKEVPYVCLSPNRAPCYKFVKDYYPHRRKLHTAFVLLFCQAWIIQNLYDIIRRFHAFPELKMKSIQPVQRNLRPKIEMIVKLLGTVYISVFSIRVLSMFYFSLCFLNPFGQCRTKDRRICKNIL